MKVKKVSIKKVRWALRFFEKHIREERKATAHLYSTPHTSTMTRTIS